MFIYSFYPISSIPSATPRMLMYTRILNSTHSTREFNLIFKWNCWFICIFSISCINFLGICYSVEHAIWYTYIHTYSFVLYWAKGYLNGILRFWCCGRPMAVLALQLILLPPESSLKEFIRAAYPPHQSPSLNPKKSAFQNEFNGISSLASAFNWNSISWLSISVVSWGRNEYILLPKLKCIHLPQHSKYFNSRNLRCKYLNSIWIWEGGGITSQHLNGFELNWPLISVSTATLSFVFFPCYLLLI